MSEYINREDALESIAYCDKVFQAVIKIEGIPVADVVDVVRCKDCIFAEETTLDREHEPDVPLLCQNDMGIGGYVSFMDYCSAGERMKENGNNA